jgi:hypothetical protein
LIHTVHLLFQAAMKSGLHFIQALGLRLQALGGVELCQAFFQKACLVTDLNKTVAEVLLKA